MFTQFTIRARVKVHMDGLFAMGVVASGPMCTPSDDNTRGVLILLDRGDILEAHPTRVFLSASPLPKAL